ncbi:hypothetical protein EMIHUDRAFT_440489, partial [Emiliania huxleyi CCMP1516]
TSRRSWSKPAPTRRLGARGAPLCGRRRRGATRDGGAAAGGGEGRARGRGRGGRPFAGRVCQPAGGGRLERARSGREATLSAHCSTPVRTAPSPPTPEGSSPSRLRRSTRGAPQLRCWRRRREGRRHRQCSGGEGGGEVGRERWRGGGVERSPPPGATAYWLPAAGWRDAAAVWARIQSTKI